MPNKHPGAPICLVKNATYTTRFWNFYWLGIIFLGEQLLSLSLSLSLSLALSLSSLALIHDTMKQCITHYAPCDSLSNSQVCIICNNSYSGNRIFFATVLLLACHIFIVWLGESVKIISSQNGQLYVKTTLLPHTPKNSNGSQQVGVFFFWYATLCYYSAQDNY